MSNETIPEKDIGADCFAVSFLVALTFLLLGGVFAHLIGDGAAAIGYSISMAGCAGMVLSLPFVKPVKKRQ